MIQILDKITKETGWRVAFLHKELPEKWGWNNSETFQQHQQQHQDVLHTVPPPITSYAQYPPTSQSQSSLPPAPPVQRKVGTGITNPMYTNADFSSQHHPYQSYYVAPNQHPHHNHYNF